MPQQQQQQQQQPQQPASSPSSKNNVNENPPQLPVIPNTPDLSMGLGESDGSGSQTAQRASEENNHWDQGQVQADRLNVVAPSGSSRVPSSSATNLTVPSSSLEKQTRPHSSPEERERAASVLTAHSSNSQLSCPGPRAEFGESDSSSSKQNSPFRLSFGKGNTSSSDSQKQPPISAPGTAVSGSSRSNAQFKASPDVSPAEKSMLSHKESKLDRSNSRRHADRDGSSEHHHKSGKAMLHLLNPMSLLARRRSSRSSRMASSRADDTKIGVPNLVPAIPDDYDPRIRGNIVHDFSAPRPRRNISTAPILAQDAAGANDPPQNGHVTEQSNQTSEQKTRHNEHPPAFKEHFEEDKNALQVENKGYLQSPLLMNPAHQDNEHSLPVFARNLPSKIPERDEGQPAEQQQEQQQPPQPPPQQPQEQAVLDPEPAPESVKKGELPPVREEEDTVVEMPQQPSGLPRHLKSNASRFSFDMTGMESSVQEKLLEEKHKEKEAERRAKYGTDDEEYSDDDFDEDLLDDMDGLEEKIPGVNTDADEDELVSGSGTMMMNKSWLSPGLSPIIGSPASPVIPNQATLPMQGAPVPAELLQNPSHSPSLYENTTPGNNDINIPQQQMNAGAPSTGPAPAPLGMNPGTSQVLEDDDDLYFDDGEFGDLDADVGDEGEKFDESIFDDETSHLYDRKKKAAPEISGEQQATRLDDSSSEEEEFTGNLAGHTGALGHAPSMASNYRAGLKTFGSLSERARDAGSAKVHGGVLSEHNLEALHNALTKAATGNDRFERTDSMSDRSMDQESAAQTVQTVESHSGLISDNSRLSQAIEPFGSEEVLEDFDYDDCDALYDDPIIAAANAEALENDDDGFYGQEFGFYAHSHGNSELELTNGGYFGPRGVEGISRSFSSRGKFREPSLTPITERSERSTRNSVISLTAAHAPGHSNTSMSSPGLAQLVDLGNLDDEMSLSALMRLRRGAWGGSNGSLRSSSASPPPFAHQPHSSSNRGSFTALSDASPTIPTIPADVIWPGNGSATGSPVRELERNGSSTASPV